MFAASDNIPTPTAESWTLLRNSPSTAATTTTTTTKAFPYHLCFPDASARESDAIKKALQISLANGGAAAAASSEVLSAATATLLTNSIITKQQSTCSGSGLSSSSAADNTSTAVSKNMINTVSTVSSSSTRKRKQRKSRASKKSPTTLFLVADPDSFKQMVHEVTGLWGTVAEGMDGGVGHGLSGPVMKPLIGSGYRVAEASNCPPTLDTSALFFDIPHYQQQQEEAVDADGPAGDVDIFAPPPVMDAEDGGTGFGFVFEAMDVLAAGFPTLESWGVI